MKNILKKHLKKELFSIINLKSLEETAELKYVIDSTQETALDSLKEMTEEEILYQIKQPSRKDYRLFSLF